MKGVDEIRSFLESGKDFSASKDALPHPQVDREALIKVLLDLHAENLALKANMPRVNSTASAGPSSSASKLVNFHRLTGKLTSKTVFLIHR